MSRFRRRSRRGQMFLFYLAAFAVVFLLCALGLDVSLMNLSQARLSRACDAASNSGVCQARPVREISLVMRNVAVANYPALGSVPQQPAEGVAHTSSGVATYTFTYATTDGRTAVVNTLVVNPRGMITRANTDSRTTYRAVFMGMTGIDALMTYNLSATASTRPVAGKEKVIPVNRALWE